MEIVTSHHPTDFDGLAAMVAAGRLYPGARLVLPGGVDRGVCEFLSLHQDLLDLHALRDLDVERVEHVILVDTQNRGRTGALAPLLRRPGLRITVYDHHLPETSDFEPSERHLRPVGATTTMLVSLMRERGLTLSPFEATLFALGIYSDTGSFTTRHTTPEDLEAAAFLRRRGADLDAVTEYLHHPLTPEQRSLLGDLLRTTETHVIHGVSVNLATVARRDYVGEAAPLVSRLLDLDNADAAFLLARMDGVFYLIGRSRTDRLDLPEILKPWGGGGHARAASARIHSDDLPQLPTDGDGNSPPLSESDAFQRDPQLIVLRNELLRRLAAAIIPEPTAETLMSRPIRTIGSDATLEEAARVMQRYGQSGLAVTREDRLVGMISRSDLDKARHHRLMHVPVKGFMSLPSVTATPDDSLSDLETRMIEANVGRIPVLQGEKLIGMVTRENLLRARYGSRYASHPRNLTETLERRVEPDRRALLRRIGEEADRGGIPVYLVGGFVRDLLRGKENSDFDFVTEGDAVALAETLAPSLQATIKPHDRFGTATLVLPDGSHLDFASARTESYAHPAALPDVERSSIEDDLKRRDFSFNAMAIRLSERHFGELLDPFHGARDLRRHLVRILHNLSFVEDPTRLMRAARFEARFGFRMEPLTHSLAAAAIRESRLATLTPERFRRELILGLLESDAWGVVQRWESLGVLDALTAGLRADPVRFQNAEAALDWFRSLSQPEEPDRPLLLLAALLSPLSPPDAVTVCLERIRYSVPRTERLRLCLERGPELASRFPGRDPAELARLLRPETLETILYAAAVNPEVETDLAAYFTRYRYVKLGVNGNDLIERGFRPGPSMGVALQAALDEKLRGRLRTREDEIEFLLRHQN